MKMIPKDFTLTLFVLLWNIINVEGKGKLAIQLVEFHNEQGLDINGQCCDGVNIPSCPLEQCDHHFTICAGDQPRVNFTDDSCQFGKDEFNAPDNENEISFTAGKSSLFSFDIWQGSAYISVVVTDSDSDGLQLVDNLHLNFTSSIPGFNSTADYTSTYTLTGLRPQHPTSLSLKAKVYCDPHYYGDDCSINCVSDNKCDGHYTCDNKGRKVCNSGWKGDNCEVMIQGGVADCSIYQDRTEFVPSVWEGQYQCPGETPQSFVLNVTHSSGDIDVVADMTIQSFVIPITGTYASSFKILTLQGKTLVPQEIGGRNLTKLELNLREIDDQAIEMRGDVLINQDKCPVLRLTRTRAYFGGCNMQGTCVRYGIRKEEFYCCCNHGTTGTSCTHTTKKLQTTPTTKPTTPTTNPTTPTTTQPSTTTPKPTPTYEPSTTAPTTSTTLPPSTSTAAPTTSTTLPPTTSTAAPTTSTTLPPSTSTAAPTTSTTLPPTTSTAAPTTSTTLPPSTSTAAPTTSTMLPPTTSTAAPTTLTTLPPTTSTAAPTTSTTLPPTTSTAAPTTSTTLPPTTSTAAPTTSTTLPPTTSTAAPTTSTTLPPSTSTAAPTTSTTLPPTTSTAAPTTSTTLPPTTSTAAPTTSTTLPPTTSTAAPTTSTTLPPSTSTAVPTPTPGSPGSTAPHPATRNVTQELFLELVAEERDTFILMGIIMAWQQANTASIQANISIYNMQTMTTYQAIGDNGVEVFEVSVTLTVPYAAKEPTADFILSQMQIVANSSLIRLYSGSTVNLALYKMDYALTVTVEGAGPEYGLKSRWETAISRALNTSCNVQTCVSLSNTVITMKKMEEFVGSGGMELTKVYYFVERDGKPLTSLTVNTSVTLSIDYVSAFTSAGLTDVKVHTGGEGTRYRFHYTLLVEGTVFNEDLPKFESLLETVWASEYPDKYKLCSLCNITIARTEQYTGDNGLMVTALVYLYNLQFTIQSPLLVPPPPVARFTSSMTLVNLDLSPYTLYMGSSVFRYTHHYSFLITGQVNLQTELTLLQSLLTTAWTNWTQTNQGSYPNYLDWNLTIKGSELYISQEGKFVTNLICYITTTTKVEVKDARVTMVPTLTWLSQVSQQWLTFKHRNGERYEVFTSHVREEMFRVQETFVLYVKGYVYHRDISAIQNAIQNAWNDTFTGITAEVTAEVLKTIIYTRTVNGTEEVLSALHYKLTSSSSKVTLLATQWSVTQKTTVYQHIVSRLTSLTIGRTYTAITTDLTSWFEWDRQFVLYFNRRLAQLDLDLKFKPALQNALKSKWKDYNLFQKVEIHIAFQEKVYIDTKSCWRVVFFLKSSDKGVINPQWVVPITEDTFNQGGSLSITSLEGHTYVLYLGQRSRNLFLYRSHFHLTFTQEVSVFDYINVTQELQGLWCNHIQGCQHSTEVTITVKEQEHFLDINGVSYWRLVYFVRFGGIWFDSRTVLDIDWVGHQWTWMSQYGVKYHTVTARHEDLWHFSYAFQLYRHTKFYNTEAQRDILRTQLQSAWTNMGFIKKECRCLDLYVVRQHQLSTASGTLWQLTYFLRYKGEYGHSWMVDSHSWPTLNSTVPTHITTGLSLTWYQSLIAVYSSTEVAVTDFSAIEKDMTASLLIQHPEFQGCSCYHVKVEFQEEVVDDKGQTSWRLYYHVYKKDHVVPLSSIRPINWVNFNHQYSVVGHYGHRYTFSWQWSWRQVYSRYSSLGGMYLSHWLSHSHYHQLATVLGQYYAHYYNESKNVTVTMNTDAREYFSTDGSSVWHIPFVLEVDGARTYPPPLNITALQARLNLTTAKGTTYSLISGSKVTSTQKFSSITVDHKVSSTAYEEIKAAIIKTLVKQFPDWEASWLKIDVGPQREMVDEKGHSSWKLHYSLSVNGTKIDTKGTLTLNSTELTSNLLKVTGPNSVHYQLASTVNTTSQVSAATLMSITLATDVSVAHTQQVQEQVKNVWKEHYGASSSVDVEFIRQKHFVSLTGESLWRWDYVLKVNGTSVRPEVVTSIDTGRLTSLLNVTASSTDRYHLKNWTSAYNNYEMHFPLYIANKVSKTDFYKFKEKVHKAWLAIGENVTVDVVSQEELVNSEGKSMWKLVYFVRKGGEVLDSRVTQSINSTALGVVEGPRGPYVTLKGSGFTSEMKYSLGSSVAIDHKLDTEGLKLMTTKITEGLEQTYKELKGKLSVSIVRQEEYLKTDGTRGWKVVYFVKVDGKTVRASTLMTGNISLSSYTGLHGVHYQVLRKSELVYNFRDRFTVTFTTKVTQKSFSKLQSSIIAAWKLTNTEYNRCGCLTIDNINANQIEEVVDQHGKSHWQLTYFLKKNSTVVESMTSSPLNLTHLRTELVGLTDAKGKAYSVVDTATVSVTRLSMAGHFYLDRETALKEQLENFTKKEWTLQGFLGHQSIKVDMIRMARFFDGFWKPWWRVEYFLYGDGSILDPAVLPDLTFGNASIPGLHGYNVSVRAPTTVTTKADYSWSFTLTVNKEVKRSHLKDFQEAVRKYWTSVTVSENVTISIPEQVKMVSKKGTFYWILPVFVYDENAGKYLDARVYSDLNMTVIQKSVETVVTSEVYRLVAVSEVTGGLRRYDTGFTLYLSSFVRRTHLTTLSTHIAQLWKTKDFDTTSKVTVSIVKQEELVTNTGKLASKMTYFLQANSTELHFNQMSELDHQKVQEVVTKVTGQKTVLLNGVKEPISGATQTGVAVATAYSYSSLLRISLTKPVLDQDKPEMETQLAKAWLSQMADRRAITVSLQRDYQIKVNLGIAVAQTINFDVMRVGFSTSQRQGVLLQLEFGKDILFSVKITDTGSVAFTVVDAILGTGEVTTEGVDYSDGEYHVVQLRTQQVTTTQWTVYMQVDDGEEYHKTILRPSGSVTTLYVGNNDTSATGQGFDGQIFLLQLGGYYPLKHAFNTPVPSGVQLSPSNMTASIYGIGHSAGLPNTKAKLKVDIEDILHLSAKILFQDEVVTEKRSSMWSIKYAVTVNMREQVRSAQVSQLSATNLAPFLNVTRSGSNDSYQYVNEDHAVDTISYRDLYHLHVNQRVAAHDYLNIQANLSTIWTTVENLTKSVTVMKQEEVIDTKGHTSWKLSYHITSKDSSSPVNPRFVDGVTGARLAEGVVTESPLGVRYKVLGVSQTYRLSQAYRFVVSRRVRIQDEVKVKTGILKLVAASQQGLQTSSLAVVAVRTDKVVDQASGKLSWQYSYIVAANGTTMDASRYTELAVTKLSQTVSGAGAGVVYRVERGVVRSYTDMFGLTLVGRTSTEITQTIQTQLTTAWSLHSAKTVVSNLRRQEFIGENGTTLTKYDYFVVRNGSLLYPSLTVKVNTDQLAHNLSVTVYNGHKETDYHDCHRLSLQGYHGSFNTAVISHTILTTWAGQDTTTGTSESNYTVAIVKREEEVGKYGLKLLTLVYTVDKDSMTLTPDYQASPERSILASAWTSSGQSGQVYGGQRETFRMSGLFQLGLQHAVNATEVTQSDRSSLEKVIHGVWNVGVSGDVKIDVVANEKFRTKENSATMNKLFYAVKIGSQVTENWERSVPDLETKLSTALTKSPDLHKKFHLSRFYGGRIRSVYLQGGVRVNETLLSQALTQAWQTNNKGGVAQVNIVSQEKFVTSGWDFFTMKVQYVVSVNRTDPEDQGVQPPSYDEVETALSSVNLGQCGQGSLKYNKVHVQGSPATLNYTRIAGAMQTTWTSKNTEIASMLKVSLKQAKYRKKRAATDSYRLVDNNGREISPVEYTVALNQEEPSSMFLDTPSDPVVSAGLRAAGTRLCMCQPRLAAQLKVKGQVSEGDKAKVTAAVKDAFLKKNPELDEADLGIELSIMNVTDPSGKRSSDVDYIVTRKDNGDVEDLIRPNEAQLTSDIQSMYSKMEKVDDEEKDDWILPVAVACGVFVLILIIIIVCYVTYIRRHRKKGDLIKQEDNVRNRNTFDKEHFSDPAMYDDQGPLKYDNPAYDNKLYL